VPTDFYELLGLPFDDGCGTGRYGHLEYGRPLLASNSMVARVLQELSGVSGSGSGGGAGSVNREGSGPGSDGGPADTVKAAYRRLQKLAHPDIAGEAATELAALLNLAYTTLSDSQVP
jgi:hypothetical protein